MKQNDFVAKVAEFEGFSKIPYKCPSGKWTIGFGRTAGVTATTPATTKETEYIWLESELVALQSYINLKYPGKFNTNELQALASFTFNCGKGNLNKLTDNGKRTNDQIAASLILYNKSNGRTLSGLVKRRQWEQSLFMQTDTYRINSRIGFKVMDEWLFYTGQTILNYDFADVGKNDAVVMKNADGVEKLILEKDIINGLYPMQFFGA